MGLSRNLPLGGGRLLNEPKERRRLRNSWQNTHPIMHFKEQALNFRDGFSGEGGICVVSHPPFGEAKHQKN